MYPQSQAFVARMRKMAAFWAAIVFAFLLLVPAASFGQIPPGQVPPVVVSSNQTLYGTLGGNTHHIAANSLGDVFYEDDGTTGGNPGTVYELVPGNPTPIALVTGMVGGHGVTVDSANNLYATNTYDNGNASIIEIPFVNESYPTASMPASLSGTNPPVCPAASAPTVVCALISQGGDSVTGYFLQTPDIQFDAKGNLYVLDDRDNDSGGAYNRIIEIPASQINQQSPSGVLIADNLPPIGAGNQNGPAGEIAVDSVGDVYYADGTNVYSFPAGTTDQTSGFTTIGTGLNAPGGVGVDASNDLIITDSGNSRLVVMPYVNGALDTSDQYLLSYTYSANSVAVGQYGNIYYSGYDGTTSTTTIGELTLWSANIGSSVVGTPASAFTLNLAFNASSTTTGAITTYPATNNPFTLTGSGTTPCAANTAYTQGESCSFNVAFTPTAVGTQTGAVVLSDTSGNPLIAGYLYGIGLGAGFTADPGMVNSIGAGWKSPTGIAVDGSGNVYVADSTANAVLEYAPSGSAPIATIGSGLSGPTSVAVDGAGNVFIGDAGNGRIVEVPLISGALSNANQQDIATELSGASGIALDAGGNLYIADSGNSRVLRLPNIAGTPSATLETTLGSGFQKPVALAVDQSGDVFVADEGTNSVTEISAATAGQTPISSALNMPTGVAVDASGSLFIVNSGAGQVIKVPSENGVLNANDQTQVGASISSPYGIALDSAGNLYVTDNADALVGQIVRTQGVLNLGSYNQDTTSAQLQASISSSGNQSLIFGTPLYNATGDTADFAVSTSQTNGCAADATLTPGFGCSVDATMTPLAAGPLAETLSFTSNAANTASPEVLLTGSGANLVPTQLALAVTSPATGAPTFGEPVSVTATLTFTANGGLTPTGTVTFVLDGQAQKPVTLSGNGTASITFSALNGGSHTISASYSGDANFAASSASPISISVSLTTSSTTLAITTPNVDPASAAPGENVTLTATVTQLGAAAPTGTVTFLDGTTSIGSAPVQGVVLCTGCATVYEAILQTTTMPTGSYDVVASYSGDVNYMPSVSAGVPIVITTPTFTISASPGTITSSPGNPGIATITLNSLSGFQGTITFSCSGLPSYAQCSFNPATYPMIPTVPAGNTNIPVTLQVRVNVPPVTPPPTVGRLSWPLRGGGSLALAILFLSPIGLLTRRRFSQARYKGWHRLLPVVALLCLLTGAIMLSGCGSSNSFTTPTGQSTVTIQAIATPAGAADGTTNITQTTQISLTVQQ